MPGDGWYRLALLLPPLAFFLALRRKPELTGLVTGAACGIAAVPALRLLAPFGPTLETLYFTHFSIADFLAPGAASSNFHQAVTAAGTWVVVYALVGHGLQLALKAVSGLGEDRTGPALCTFDTSTKGDSLAIDGEAVKECSFDKVRAKLEENLAGLEEVFSPGDGRMGDWEIAARGMRARRLTSLVMEIGDPGSTPPSPGRGEGRAAAGRAEIKRWLLMLLEEMPYLPAFLDEECWEGLVDLCTSPALHDNGEARERAGDRRTEDSGLSRLRSLTDPERSVGLFMSDYQELPAAVYVLIGGNLKHLYERLSAGP